MTERGARNGKRTARESARMIANKKNRRGTEQEKTEGTEVEIGVGRWDFRFRISDLSKRGARSAELGTGRGLPANRRE